MPKVLLDLIRLSYRDIKWEMKFSVKKCTVIYMDREKQIYKYNTIINSGKKKKSYQRKCLKNLILHHGTKCKHSICWMLSVDTKEGYSKKGAE